LEDPKLLNGLKLSIKYSKDLLRRSVKYYGNHDYQTSIPLGVLSIEESFKAHFLCYAIEKSKKITKNEWCDLKDHKFKLTFEIGKTRRSLQRISEYELKRELKKLEKKFQ